MFIATSSRPLNITTGTDLNGDTVFADRPAFATDLSRPSVVHTAFGVFDLAPMPGQRIIPRNYGIGPGLVSLNLRLAKTFKLGKEVKGKRDPMELTFTALSRNLLNHPNLALPDGNLSSPYFGESTALVTGGGGNSASGNRLSSSSAGSHSKPEASLQEQWRGRGTEWGRNNAMGTSIPLRSGQKN
jgi:hypothetical protein